MEDRKVFIIGLIVFIGVSIVIFLSFFMNRVRFFTDNNYVLVKFSHADGVKVNDEVRYRGVKCGTVVDVLLKRDFVLLKLWLKKDFTVGKNSLVAIQDLGIIGGTKYIFIQPSDDTLYRYPYDTLVGINRDFNISEIGIMVSDIREMVFNAIPSKERVDEIVDTLFSALKKINDIVEKNDKDISSIVTQLSYSSDKITTIVDSLYPAMLSLKKEIEIFSEGNGSVKRILREDTVYIRLNESLRKLNRILDQLEKNKIIKGCL
ncbi:MAG: Mce related protein [candidate division TA06 bacterium 32_111]|uniref:Mce related protein n=2 Tax=Bacteria candidate phyla TaxID=1783234 RepID=A0A101I0Y8_UNCT6|nr:MAG: Mce related protein [candidate division TA06 bacterium 32_111]KUK86718.1 MAG: Mce related protein [candidate division TA06 bacterium 34_109]HAF08346.1 hypothetical protein [candidate division WOR-3 bacterium]